MNEAEIEHRLTAVETRMDVVEANQSILQDLATGVTKMGAEIKTLASSVDKLDVKVGALETKPAKKYDALIEKIVWALVASVITFVLSHIGL